MFEESVQYIVPFCKCADAVWQASIKRRDHKHLLCNANRVNATKARGKDRHGPFDDEEI